MKPGRVLPGQAQTLGFTWLYLSLVVLIPLSGLVVSTTALSWGHALELVQNPRVLASIRLSIRCALLAAVLDVGAGGLIAWVLGRYELRWRSLFDAMVDLPFALPTSVAGITLTYLYAEHGPIGRWLAAAGIRVAFTPAGIVLALAFVGLPFAVRTVQSVVQEMDRQPEEAARTLGATTLQTFWRVQLPRLVPALLTGFALSLARALGEYGSVVFISGNLPFRTEIAPLRIVTQLEQYDDAGAALLATMMLVASLVLLGCAQLAERWATTRFGSHEAGVSSGVPERSRPLGAARAATVATVGLLCVFVAIPVGTVFSVAFSRGVGFFLGAVSSPETLAAVKLTGLTVLFAVPLNTAFGLAAAWAITKFTFRGKTLLLSLIDLPLAVSPVVAGLMLVLIFGGRGPLGRLLADHGIHVIYALPGLVLATVFVTFPFVARELIPLMESLGSEEEIAATSLGANGWQVFWRVTLPNIRWGLLGGVVLCTARAMGEFGAVSVVSGHIRGETNTLPLHVEILYNEYNQVGAFAAASLLSLVGLLALGARKVAEQP